MTFKTALLLATALLPLAQANAADKCPPLVASPKQVVCNLRMSDEGAPESKQQLVIDIATADQDAPHTYWEGSSKFTYPYAGIGDGSNPILAKVYQSRHGNAPCPDTQSVDLEMTILGRHLEGDAAFFSYKSGPSPKLALNFDISCTIR